MVRPAGCTCLTVEAAKMYQQSGKGWVVDLELKAFLQFRHAQL